MPNFVIAKPFRAVAIQKENIEIAGISRKFCGICGIIRILLQILRNPLAILRFLKYFR